MIPLVVGAVLAVVALVWVIAPIFAGDEPGPVRPAAQNAADDAAAEAEIRKWRTRS